MTTDEQIGRNVAAQRGDMSQKELAAKMRERGWKWSQATVWSIEKGERPLRLAEAKDLAQVLHVFSESEFTRPEAEATVMAWTREHSRLESALEELILEYTEAQMQLALAADEAELGDSTLGRMAMGAITLSVADIERRVIRQDHGDSGEWPEAPDVKGTYQTPYLQRLVERMGEADGVR